jgi:hypothetical protein
LLCGDRRPDAAIVVLRSIVEGWINSMYILGHPNEGKAYLYAIEDAYYRRGLAIGFENFYKIYPKLRTTSMTRKAVRGIQDQANKDLETFKTKRKISFKNKKAFKKAWGSLLSRAQWIDKRLYKRQKDQAGGFEHTYLLVYKYLSEYTHLSMRGLEHFWKKGSSGDSLILDKNAERIDLVIATTYTIYLHFAKRLRQYKLISGSFAEYDKFFKEKISFSSP